MNKKAKLDADLDADYILELLKIVVAIIIGIIFIKILLSGNGNEAVECICNCSKEIIYLGK